MSMIPSWLRAALVSTTLLTALTLRPGTASATTDCSCSGYYAENITVYVDNAQPCVDVTADSASCTCSGVIRVHNGCDVPLVAKDFSFCAGDCKSLEPGQDGNIELDTPSTENGKQVEDTFTAELGDQTTVIHVKYLVSYAAPSASDGSGCSLATRAPSGHGWLFAGAAALALCARRSRRSIRVRR